MVLASGCIYPAQIILTLPSSPVAAEISTILDRVTGIAGAILDNDTGELLEYCYLMNCPKYQKVWDHSFGGNTIGRLSQGMEGRVEGTNTIFSINKKRVPTAWWKDVVYGKRIVYDCRPGKSEPNRMRLTVWGDRINYTEDCGSLTANLLTVKLLLTSSSTHWEQSSWC